MPCTSRSPPSVLRCSSTAPVTSQYRPVDRFVRMTGPDRPECISRLHRHLRGDLPEVFGGMGVSILSTSRGIMTGREAKNVGVGGEVLCNVW